MAESKLVLSEEEEEKKGPGSHKVLMGFGGFWWIWGGLVDFGAANTLRTLEARKCTGLSYMACHLLAGRIIGRMG
jgi:hypothetical protein